MLRSLFTRDDVEVRAITGQASLWGDWPGTDAMSRTWAGTTVDAHASLQLLTVYGCVRLISDSISTLPIDCYRQTGDIKTDISTPQWLLQPTVDLDFTSWCGQVLSSLLLSGNAYLAVLRSEAGTILELVPLDPAKVQVRREQGRKVYFIDGSRYAGEMVHIPGLMLPGSDVGMSPVEYARQSIGLGLAATQYGAAWFDGEGNMPGVIEAPRALQPETMKAMAEHWRRRRNRANRGLPGVLQEGATWKPTGVTNEQMQFLQTRQYTAAEIAGQMFLVDPSDLGIGVAGSSLTYANLADRNTRRVQVTLLPWITRIEHAVSSLMLRPRYMKFNVNALLRADLAARYSSYATGIGAGFLLPDEARELEDLPPLAPTEVDDGAA
jgi:HK97 family phage portal protein